MFSCGRDKVIILWDIQARKQLKTVALYDSLETMVMLPKQFYFQGLEYKSSGLCTVAGGENGKYFSVNKKKCYSNGFKCLGNLHIWDVENNIPLYKEENKSKSEKSTKSILNIIYNEARLTLAVCYVDNTITLHQLGPNETELTVCQYNYNLCTIT